MKQIVKYEVYLSNEIDFVKNQSSHVFEKHFVSNDVEDLRVIEDSSMILN